MVDAIKEAAQKVVVSDIKRIVYSIWMHSFCSTAFARKDKYEIMRDGRIIHRYYTHGNRKAELTENWIVSIESVEQFFCEVLDILQNCEGLTYLIDDQARDYRVCHENGELYIPEVPYSGERYLENLIGDFIEKAEAQRY